MPDLGGAKFGLIWYVINRTRFSEVKPKILTGMA